MSRGRGQYSYTMLRWRLCFRRAPVAAFMGGKARKISQKTDFEANAGIYSNKGGGM